MKPAFTLSFSATGISLHHLSEGEWYEIGTVSLDTDDLNGQIQALRDQGFALENDLSCNVVIPADQIRYLTIPSEDLSTDENAQMVQDALVDATPYERDELSFASITKDGLVYGAAVARQTLNEAHSFTTEHGFVPVAYTAEPSEDEFPCAPVFDLSAEPLMAAPIATPEPSPAPETPEPKEDTNPSPPKVHAIAETAAPDAFRAPAPSQGDPASSGAGLNKFALPAIAATGLLAIVIGAWSLLGSPEKEIVAGGDLEPETTSPEAEMAADLAVDIQPEVPEAGNTEPEVEPVPEDDEVATAEPAPEATPEDQPALSATDAAILEALKVEPTPVEDVAQEAETAPQSEIATGVVETAPAQPAEPVAVEPDDLYLASVDKSDFSNDAVALAPSASFETDQPFDLPALARASIPGFDLDERGLVTPSPEGTLNPDGVLVYLGRPSSVPPAVPLRFEEEPVVEETTSRLAGIRPKPRPENLQDQFERQQLGGRSLQELSVLRPKQRPASLQASPEVDDTPTALAVVLVPRPKARPAGLVRTAAAASATNLGSTAGLDQNSGGAETFEPKTVAPKIPTTASVARQATIDNAINLRRLNLIGVYGTPANRRALVRLPSGRYKKLKVGDRVDGGKVVAISDSELLYQKKGRNVSLKMPRG
ncbi:MAG: hypothetical protein AAFX90_10725 [Pseudomonadota bacterium]